MRLLLAQCKFMRFLGISNLYFDPKTQQFRCKQTNQFCLRIYLNTLLAVYWSVGIIIQSWFRYKLKHFVTLNIGLALTAGAYVAINLLILQMYFSKTYCQTLNGIHNIYKQMNRKLNNTQFLSVFKPTHA